MGRRRSTASTREPCHSPAYSIHHGNARWIWFCDGFLENGPMYGGKVLDSFFAEFNWRQIAQSEDDPQPWYDTTVSMSVTFPFPPGRMAECDTTCWSPQVPIFLRRRPLLHSISYTYVRHSRSIVKLEFACRHHRARHWNGATLSTLAQMRLRRGKEWRFHHSSIVRVFTAQATLNETPQPPIVKSTMSTLITSLKQRDGDQPI